MSYKIRENYQSQTEQIVIVIIFLTLFYVGTILENDEEEEVDEDEDEEEADVNLGLLHPRFRLLPSRQYLRFKNIFTALETIIEETLQHHLMPKWSVLPKKTLREFRSSNQIAITLCFRYQGSEFHDLHITVDFALVLPSKKSPLWYDLPKQVDAEPIHTCSGYKSLLIDSSDTHYYVIKNHNECRLSYGMEEADMLSKYDANAFPLECIRIYKKLRDMVSTHVFDIASETVAPIIPSYWLKTIGLFVFDLNKNTVIKKDPSRVPLKDLNKELAIRESCDSTSVGYWVFKIFTTLYNCLSGYENTQKPWLSSYNVPFKNLLSGSSREDDVYNALTDYLHDDQKERLGNKRANALADTKVLLEILSQFDENEYAAREKLLAVRSRMNEKNIEIYEQGMRDKMGLLLYDYFHSLEKEKHTAVKTPAYMDFISENFPNIQVISLDKFIDVHHFQGITAVNITLVEKGLEVDLKGMFDRALLIRWYYKSKEDNYLNEDYYLAEFLNIF